MNGAGFDRWSYRSSAPMSIEALREMVKRRLPETVYRCKGIIHAAEAPERRFVLQIVGRRTHVTDLGEWGSRPPASAIVAIGQGMDRESLDALFDDCLAPSPAPPA